MTNPPTPKPKTLQIRNSTAEFLIFTRQAGESTIEVRVEDETVWLSQKLMAALFEVSVPTINEHLANLYDQMEIVRSSTIRDFLIVQNEGGRQVSRKIEFYNLDAIIAVGFQVNSTRAIQFRQWATGVLRDLAIRGYVLDKERLKNGAFFSKEFFDDLLAETTKTFFATVQNKLPFAIHGHTAAELILKRADSKKERMGLTTSVGLCVWSVC
jgi:hypothetical protein